MITASQIADRRAVASDYPETERLKSYFATVRRERDPFYLNLTEFDDVLRWKLRGQYGRQQLWRHGNNEEIVRAVTGTALSIHHEDQDYELELRTAILCALRGVGVPVASAVLALVFPEDYCVVDFRGWRQVFGEERRQFGIAEYKRYLREIRRLARDLGWPAQEVDLAVWAYDMRHSGRGIEEGSADDVSAE